LSIPTASGANTVSSIAIAAYKKLVLLQALSPLGILHTTMIRLEKTGGEDSTQSNELSSTSVIGSSTGMSSGTPQITIPSATNPLSTPTEMPWDLVRYISQANPPTPGASPSSNVTGHSVDTSTSQASTRTRYTYPHFGVHVYQLLLHAFVAIDRKKFDTLVNEFSDLFHNDGNHGYITRLSNALYYRQIYVISRTFASVPIQQLSTEMKSLPVDQIRVLLQKLEEKFEWPVTIIKISKSEGNEDEEVVIFPSDLPRPINVRKDDESMLEPQRQLMELSQKMQQVNFMMESSSKYKTAMAYYDRQRQQKNSKSNEGVSGASSMVLDDSFLHY
jgi:hypothetical protein